MTTKADIAKLRACLRCQFVQRGADFNARGCPNCEAVLQMQGSQDTVLDCTTSNFDGLVSMIHPDQSWVAKWQHIEKRVPGLYAVKTTGRLPEQYE
ncbi:putative SPT4-transcription elongation protein [Tilletiaria anomala UBC 951]|uniref:Transcription elongation factor SPT4 n=1 Tax=Tilletiaria anomala (strain ATCC 24038 / CBS 436.72 / UBC 951) TaxID=1037660 RepID=A0A066WF65_TILAU|nr:putative SPT4-transcription elongation protein [Tilletiaria anomala UBC 951]KDN52622.1 putative SPT4-transcription elongation protein [Tilletiaria anomala UBC 951]